MMPAKAARDARAVSFIVWFEGYKSGFDEYLGSWVGWNLVWMKKMEGSRELYIPEVLPTH